MVHNPLFHTFHLFSICQNVLLFNMIWDAKIFQMSVTLIKLENSYIQPRKPLCLCFKSRWCGKIRQPAFARVTEKGFRTQCSLSERVYWKTDMKFHHRKVGIWPIILTLADIWSAWRKASSFFFFLELCSTSFLNPITEQSVIKSAEKVNAQCISNEALLIALL